MVNNCYFKFSWNVIHCVSIFSDTLSRCINDKIDPYVLESLDLDSHIKYPPSTVESDSAATKPDWLIHFVGNGMVGAESKPDSPLYIKSDKVLSLAVPFQPIASVFLPNSGENQREASVLQFVNGLAHKIQCIPYGKHCITITHQIYAHRTISSLLVQDIKITNPTDEDVVLSLERGGLSKWLTSVVYTHK